MSFERPWRKEYENLLNEMHGTWGGEILRKDDLTSGHFKTAASPDINRYPAYTVKRNNFNYMVDIAEQPLYSRLPYAGMDNIEYIQISMSVKHKHLIIINPESILDKMFKAVRLRWEFQTGNPEFDKKYYLELRTEKDKNLVIKADFQNLVYQLAPFEELAVHGASIVWSREIRNESILTFDQVELVMKNLWSIAKLID